MSAKRIAIGAAKVVATAIVFVVALVAGVFLHSGTPPARRFVVAEINSLLAGKFQGSVHLDAVSRVGLGTVRGVDATVRDANGRTVAHLSGVRARLDVPALVGSLLRSEGPLVVTITRLVVERVDVTLARTEEGKLTLAEAFAPREPTPPNPNARGLAFALRDARIDAATIRGDVGGEQPIEAHLGHASASFESLPSGVTIALEPFDADARGGPLPAPIAAHLGGRVELPKREEPRARFDLDAHVGEVPVTARATLEQNRLVARVDVPETQPDAIKSVFASAPIEDPVAFHVDVNGVLPRIFPMIHGRVGAGTIDGAGEIVLVDGARGDMTLDAANVHASSFSRSSPDAAVTATVRVRFDSKEAAFDSRVRGELRRSARVAASGRIAARARGRYEIGAKVLDGRVEGTVERVAIGALAIDRGEIASLFRGPPAALRADGAAHVVGVKLGARSLPDAEVKVTGAIRHPIVAATADVGKGTRVEARAELDFAHGFGARDAVATATRAGARILARATGVHVGGRRIDVNGFELAGLGAPLAGTLHVTPRRMQVKAKSTGLDVSRAVAFFGPIGGLSSGRALVDVDYDQDDGGARGHVGVRFDHVAIEHVHDANGRIDLRFDGRALDGGAFATVPPIGTMQAVLSNVRLGGPPTDPKAWRAVEGAVDVNGALALDKLEELFPPDTLPISRSRGKLTIDGRLRRASAKAEPSFELAIATQGLALTGRPPPPAPPKPPEAVPPPAVPWRIDGVDLQLLATYGGARDRASVMVRAVDKAGPIVSATATADVPLRDLERRPRSIDELESLPIAVRVDVPDREAASLPAWIRPKSFRGVLGLHADVTGTARAPHLALLARARCVQPTLSKQAVPLDFDAAVTYDGSNANVSVRASRPKRGGVLDSEALVRARWTDVLAKRVPEDWGASAVVHLTDFPLAAVPTLADRDIDALVSGTVDLGQLHEAGRVDAQLTLDQLRVGRSDYPRGKIAMTLDDRGLRASVDLRRAETFLHATVDAAAKWGNAIAPALDTSKPAEITLSSKGFRAAALLPLLGGAVDELDGEIDSDARVHVKPGFKDGTMDGAVRIRGGSVEIPRIGQQLRDVSATIDIKPWGTLNVRDVRASGINGNLTADATAKLEGFTLVSAEAHVRIPNEMPITLEGVHLADASGVVNLKAQRSPDGRTMTIDVDVPHLNADLPQKSGHSVQPLDPNPSILVGTYRPDGRFVQIPMQAPEKPRDAESMHLRVAVKLDDVDVKRDNEVRVALVGWPVIDVTDKTHMSGQIKLVSGAVEVQGKRFVLEHGVVTFVGEPSNPEVAVTAYWDAPDGTRVFADVTGDAKKPKIALRSEPPHSQNDILSLLLTGQIGGDMGAPQPPPAGTGAAAASIGASVLTTGINQVLTGVTNVGIQTKVDTSNAQNPRPEIEVQLSRDVYVQVAYNAGLPPPGEAGDRTLVMLNYRFERNWSLQTTVGDAGSSILDVLWKYRY